MNSWISAELGCPDLQGPEIMPLPSDPDSGGLGEGPRLLFTMCSGTGRSPWRAAFPPGWERPSPPATQPQTVLTTISDESLGGPQTQICRPSPTLILFPQTLADSNRLRVHRFLSARQPLHPLLTGVRFPRLRETRLQSALSLLDHAQHAVGIPAAAPTPSNASKGLLEQFALSDGPGAPAAAPWNEPTQDSILLPSQLSPERNHNHVCPGGDFKVQRASSRPSSCHPHASSTA